MLTRSTYDLSNAVEALITLEGRIHSGNIDIMPIEQRLATLYSGDIVIQTLMSHDEGMFTEEEIRFVNALQYVIAEELANIGVDNSSGGEQYQ